MLQYPRVVPKVLVGDTISSIYPTSKNYCNALSGHSEWTCSCSNCLGRYRKYLVVMQDGARSHQSLSFSQRTYSYSCRCPVTFSWSLVYMKDEVYRQKLLTIVELKQYISVLYQSIPAVLLILNFANCVFRFYHAVSENAEYY